MHSVSQFYEQEHANVGTAVGQLTHGSGTHDRPVCVRRARGITSSAPCSRILAPCRCPGLQSAYPSRSKPRGAPFQMSIAPPEYATHGTDPGSGNRHADDTVQYEFKSVQTLRGRKDSTRAKWQNQGWEFVSEDRGKLRTELNFRRVKPKAL